MGGRADRCGRAGGPDAGLLPQRAGGGPLDRESARNTGGANQLAIRTIPRLAIATLKRGLHRGARARLLSFASATRGRTRFAIAPARIRGAARHPAVTRSRAAY